jgi:hypothetical protein
LIAFIGDLDMRPDLQDAKAAIDWAVSQLPSLQQRINAWVTDKPYAVRIDTDTEPGKKLYRLADIKPFDPLINAEAGAIIHSIRSSLDLLACTLAARNGFPNDKRTYFPIWKSQTDFLTNADPRPLEKIQRLSQIDQNVIKDLRPYPGGNNLLVALHNLDLTRKHRRLLDIYAFGRGIGFVGFQGGTITRHRWEGFKEEAVLISTPADATDGEVTLGLNIAFDEPGTLYGENFTAVIRSFAKMAYDTLVLFAREG